MFYRLILMLLFLVGTVEAANLPTTIKGQSETTKVKNSDFQVPNNLATKIAAGTYLLENGNTNMLVNPSFEHLNPGQGWTTTFTGTAAATPEQWLDFPVAGGGKKALRILCNGAASGGTCAFKQTINSNAAMAGSQGLAFAYIRNSSSSIKVKVYADSVLKTTINPAPNGPNANWSLVKIPFLFGSTSNALEFELTAAANTLPEIIIDHTFMGPVDLKSDMATTETQTSFVISSASTTSPNKLAGATTSTGGSTSLFSYNSSTGIYTALKDITTTISMAVQTSTTTNLMAHLFVNGTVVTMSSLPSSMGLGWWQGSAWEGKILAGQTFYGQIDNGTSGQHRVSVSAKVFTSSSTYSTNNSDTDWATCNFSTLAWQGLGTVTNRLKCKRQGSDLIIRGSFITGTITAVQARIPLPVWGGVQLATSSTVTTSESITGRIIRHAAPSGSNKDHVGLLVPSASYFNIGIVESSNTLSPLTPVDANSLFAAGETGAIGEVRIPIEGWDQSNIMIGQFNGLESCKDSYECTDTFSAYVSATGVVSSENLDWITGNCALSQTSQFDCTIKSGMLTTGMNCSATTNISIAYGQNVHLAQSTATAVTAVTANNATSTRYAFTLVCQKQGADYLGKTAKAVASDQNVRTPGVVNSGLFSTSLGGTSYGNNCTASPCTLDRNIGSVFSGATRGAIGTYTASLDPAKISSGQFNCSCSAVQWGVDEAVCYTSAGATSLTVQIRNKTGVNVDGAASITCHGVLK